MSSEVHKVRIKNGHPFHKLHFAKPTWCAVCLHFIWGIGKQGYSCNVCGLNLHKKCIGGVDWYCGDREEDQVLSEDQSSLQRLALEESEQRPAQSPASSLSPHPPLTLRSSQRVLRETPKTAEEDDVSTVNIQETKLQTAPPPKQIIANLEAGVFRLEAGKWVMADGGISRLVIFYEVDDTRFHIVALSREKQFVVNGYITATTRYKVLSDTFVAAAANTEKVDIGFSFSSAVDARRFSEALQKIIDKSVAAIRAKEGLKHRANTQLHSIPSPSSPTPRPASPSPLPSPSSPLTSRKVKPESGSLSPHMGRKVSADGARLFRSKKTMSIDLKHSSPDLMLSPSPELKAEFSPFLTPQVNRRSKTASFSSSSPTTPLITRRRTSSIKPMASMSPEEKMLQMQIADEDAYKISLELYDTAFVPSQQIAELTLILEKAAFATSVAILFQGFEKAFNGLSGPGKKTYHSKQFFATRLVVWQPTETELLLEKGEYHWAFSYQLPDHLPPTMAFEDWLFLFYQARGYVEQIKTNRPRTKMISETILFDVYGVTDPKWNSVLSESLPVPHSQHFKKNKISVNAHLKRNNWHKGETVSIHSKFSNESSTSPIVKVELFQSISIAAPNFRREFSDIKLVQQLYKEEKLEKGTDQMRIFEVSIPADDKNYKYVLPSIQGSLFNISHQIRVKLVMPLLNENPSFSLPVILWDGTIDSESLSFMNMVLR